MIATSLPGEPGSGTPFVNALGFDNFIRQVDLLLARAGFPGRHLRHLVWGIDRAALCCTCRPGRVSALVLVSSLGPEWRQARSESSTCDGRRLPDRCFSPAPRAGPARDSQRAGRDLRGASPFPWAPLAAVGGPGGPHAHGPARSAAARESFEADCLPSRAQTWWSPARPTSTESSASERQWST